MSNDARLVLLICADAAQTKAYVAALTSVDNHAQVRPVENLTQADYTLQRLGPRVVLLDESAVRGREDPEKIVADLVEHAPVVFAANLADEEGFSFLIGSGAVDVVARVGGFTRVAAGLVDRRMRLAERTNGDNAAYAYGEDFGELLRHEMNNPLTGILGNAELLLSKRERLTPQAVVQLETIASLAMRLRETIRRLSETWEASRHQAHTA
jgi:signal transduction histidine kinase